ncbi:peptidase family M12A-domain-containing protein [Gorgonomyces haynaldii]|nr:peptidase family M12A-domain-containing protein [Gorgonomyces haynaldii]
MLITLVNALPANQTYQGGNRDFHPVKVAAAPYIGTNTTTKPDVKDGIIPSFFKDEQIYTTKIGDHDYKYVVRGNHAIAFGDVMIGSVVPKSTGRVPVPGAQEHTLKLASPYKEFDQRSKGKRGAIEPNVAYWSDGNVQYTWGNIDDHHKDCMAQAMQSWTELNGFNFVYVDPNYGGSHVVMSSDQGGCYATLGRQGGASNLNVGEGCEIGACKHELGMIHEQSRPDRDQYVNVFYDNIQDGLQSQFDIDYAVTPNDESVYQTNSIMQYPSYAFSKNDQWTITRKSDNGFIEYNNDIQDGDIIAIRTKYQDFRRPGGNNKLPSAPGYVFLNCAQNGVGGFSSEVWSTTDMSNIGLCAPGQCNVANKVVVPGLTWEQENRFDGVTGVGNPFGYQFGTWDVKIGGRGSQSNQEVGLVVDTTENLQWKIYNVLNASPLSGGDYTCYPLYYVPDIPLPIPSKLPAGPGYVFLNCAQNGIGSFTSEIWSATDMSNIGLCAPGQCNVANKVVVPGLTWEQENRFDGVTGVGNPFGYQFGTWDVTISGRGSGTGQNVGQVIDQQDNLKWQVYTILNADHMVGGDYNCFPIYYVPDAPTSI